MVEPVCKVLQVAPPACRRRVARRRNPELRSSRREQRDTLLLPEITRVWNANQQVYGAVKVWKQLQREGIQVARCTVERRMRRPGLQGVIRGKAVRTTVSNPLTPCPPDRVRRRFTAGPKKAPAGSSPGKAGGNRGSRLGAGQGFPRRSGPAG